MMSGESSSMVLFLGVFAAILTASLQQTIP